ncbi:unnamed protein product [marine sediment metagenome]|uniref:Uncharacterized protein n=1 Tax=marine sediment metagenome TaxID=412755 RepID=X1F767_9ZZZZ
MKELILLGSDGVIIDKRMLDVEGPDIEVVYDFPLIYPLSTFNDFIVDLSNSLIISFE